MGPRRDGCALRGAVQRRGENTITRIAGNVILDRMPLLGNDDFCRELAPADSEAIARLMDGRTVTRPLAV